MTLGRFILTLRQASVNKISWGSSSVTPVIPELIVDPGLHVVPLIIEGPKSF